MNPENHPGEEPSASSSTYVQNSMHQEQHNQFATVNILKQGPDEEAVRHMISKEAQHVGQKVYETTAGEVTDKVESLKGHQAREMANLKTNIGKEVTTFVQNQIENQDQRCESRARSASKDSVEEAKSIVDSQARMTAQHLQELHDRTQTQIQDLRQGAVQERAQQQDWMEQQGQQITELKNFIQETITAMREHTETTV